MVDVTSRWVGVVLGAVLGAGCSQNVYSPPARPFPLESARTSGTGHTGVDVTASAHANLFGPSLVAMSVRGRQGVTEQIDVTVDGSAARVDEESVAGTERDIYFGRVGAKYNPDHSVIAFTAGAGGGYAPAGGAFVAGDLGVVIAFENCHFVPFVSLTGFASQPLAPRPIDVTTPDDDQRVMDTPSTTLGSFLTFGARVPLVPLRCKRRQPHPAIVFGMGRTTVQDRDARDELLSLGIGIDMDL
jgi:hypothetical protein